jgi:DNA-binding response OmpR family regulator
VTSGSAPRVLIIDDDDLTRAAIAGVLEEHGYLVREAGDGLRGLDLARTWRPHLILLDLVLPRMNGWEFVDAYRRQVGPDGRILVMTGLPRVATLPAGISAGEVLRKPLDFELLLEAVAFHLPAAAA